MRPDCAPGPRSVRAALATEVGEEAGADGDGIAVGGEEVHKFGEGRFGGHVATGDDADVEDAELDQVVEPGEPVVEHIEDAEHVAADDAAARSKEDA